MNPELLTVDGVTLQYKTARHLVTATYRVDFAVHEADRFVILGPSGCGKSTLLKAVGGFMRPVEGRIAMGETIKIRSQAAPGRAFPVKVTGFDPPARLRFSGGMPLGLFRGVRTYELTDDADGQVKFRMREQYDGPLLPLIWRSMPDLGPSFQQFARGLKQQVESGG